MCLNCVMGINSQADEKKEEKRYERTCKQIFLDVNKSWPVLLTMCIGCKQDDINFLMLIVSFTKNTNAGLKFYLLQAQWEKRSFVGQPSLICRRLLDQKDGQKQNALSIWKNIILFWTRCHLPNLQRSWDARISKKTKRIQEN